jgi:hypothetical protein
VYSFLEKNWTSEYIKPLCNRVERVIGKNGAVRRERGIAKETVGRNACWYGAKKQ